MNRQGQTQARPRLRLLPAVALAALVTPACFAVHFKARQSVPGEPAYPATRAERIAVPEKHDTPDQILLDGGDAARPQVIKTGLITETMVAGQIRTVLLSVRIAAGARTEILDMTWSPVSAPRCMGGHPALAILTDAEGQLNSRLAERPQVRWERPLTLQGEQVLSGRFDEDPPLLHQPSVVDVRLATFEGGTRQEACLRVPMTGPEVTFWNLKRWSFGARLSWRRAAPFTNNSMMILGASFGRWVGPVRIGLQGVLGGSNDLDSIDGQVDPNAPHAGRYCFLLPGPDCENVRMGGVGVEASGFAWRQGRWGLGWSVGYDALFASMQPKGRHASAGSPRLGLQVLRLSPDVAGVSRFSPTYAWGLEFFVAGRQEWSGGSAGPPIAWGVSLLGF